MQKKNKRGFTLIESLVAIAILMVAISGPMYLARKGLATAELSTDQMIASFLAQDAMEAIKNVRDQVALSTVTSNTFWLSPFLLGGSPQNCFCSSADAQCSNFNSPSTPYCNVDTTPGPSGNGILDQVYPAGDPNVNPMRIHSDSSGNFLYYDLGNVNPPSNIIPDKLKFFRYFNISTTTLSGEAVVRVRVSWQEPAGQQNIDLKDYIYNYSNNPNITN